MLKKLDILIIRSFIGPFIVTFFVALFVLVMQFFWLYMDELIGKGLNIWVIAQLLFYMSATMVPLALPLSVLLASLMTFGNMGENFELIAIKSAGISLLRFMRPLGVFVIFICGLAFIFNNNFIPVANLKALSLLYDVRNSKPTLSIKPGRFNNDIQGFSIKVGSKDEDGNTIRDIVIYDHTDLVGNNKVILAKEGQMLPSGDKQALLFRLKDGWIYEEGYEHNAHAPEYPQKRMHFASWDKIFDLSSFNFTRTNTDMFKNAYQMMNVKQLSDALDSTIKENNRSVKSASAYLIPYVTIANNTKEGKELSAKTDSSKKSVSAYKQTFAELVPTDKKMIMLQTTCNSLHNIKSLLNNNTVVEKLHRENLQRLSIEYHKKFTLTIACLLMFLIGAPLGAIIRKGGLGLPMVIAVAFFVAFLMLNKTGENVSKTSVFLPIWFGVWMCTFILTPIAAWFIIKARADSPLFTKEAYLKLWRAIAGNTQPKKNAKIG